MSIEDTIKQDAQKIETEAKAEVSKLESGTYSGKVLLAAIGVALFIGAIIGHLL